MNKSESKYFNTAALMDEALIALLRKKDLEYITVKEVCEKAGVNRSTFYLHYETLSDLTVEAMEYVDRRFLSYFLHDEKDSAAEIPEKNLDELILISTDYLFPYLKFILENKSIYRAAFRNPHSVQAHARYTYLKKYVMEPILTRFGIPQEHQKYYISFYIEGTAAIIKEWLRTDCTESVETVAAVIERCVHPIKK